MKKITLFAAILLFFSACKKDPILPSDYFIFGFTTGRCFFDCTNLFMLKDQKLFQDDMLHLEDFKFQTTALDDSKRQLATEVFDKLPTYLMERPNETIGCPDCVDQGTLYIEWFHDGNKTIWRIDPQEHSQPEEIKEFITVLKTKIDEISQ